MANEAYSKFPLGASEPNYFEATDPRNYSSQFTAEPQDTRTRSPAALRDDNTSPTHMQGEAAHTDHGETAAQTLPPELIAKLTEKIKNEVVEQLKQTGTIQVPTEQDTHPPLQRPSSNKSSTTSSPPAPTDRKIYTPPSPNNPKPGKFSASPPIGPRRSPPESPDEKPSIRFTDTTKPSVDPYDEKENMKHRPGPTIRTFSTVELSTIDQKWGRLFEGEHTPTLRLEQFLKGLANHIVEEYEPKKSIVVTPEKMAQFYSNHSLDREIHPLTSIFKSQKNKQISVLYQDLCCQHHFVQETLDSPPSVPALTPYGFAQWMTTTILAYPNEEAERLNKIVVALPIDADGQMVDGKPERLPKQISRHLLPSRENKKSRQQFDEAIGDFLETAGKSSMPRRRATITSPALSRRQSFSLSSSIEIESPLPSPLANQIERERMPYGGTPSAAVSDTSAPEDQPTGIERERKPYSANPGAGKIYADTINLSAPPAGHRRRSRANSTGIDEYASPSDNRHPRSSAPRSGGGRNRKASPPPSRGFRTSEPVLDTSGGGYAGPAPLNSAASAPGGYKNFSPAGYAGGGGKNVSIPPAPMSASFDSRDRNGSTGSESRDRDRERDRDRDRDRERERDRDRDRERERERDRDDDRERRYPARERDGRERERERDRKRDSHLSSATRRNTEDEARLAGLYTSPRDAERYDRLHDGGGSGGGGSARNVEDYYREREKDRDRERERERGGRVRGRDLE